MLTLAFADIKGIKTFKGILNKSIVESMMENPQINKTEIYYKYLEEIEMNDNKDINNPL